MVSMPQKRSRDALAGAPKVTVVSLFSVFNFGGFSAEGRGCVEEGCLGLPGAFPDIF